MERNNAAPSPLVLRVILALAIFGATFFVAMMAVGVVTYFIPRQFYSKVVMEVKPDAWGGPLFNSVDPASRTTPGSNLQATQFQIIQNKEILYPVIDDLKLVETWGAQKGVPDLPKEEVYRKLLSQITLASPSNTNLIELGVYSTDRWEAANIANMIAVVYQKVLRDDRMKAREAILVPLRNETATQQKTVEQAHAKMREIQQTEGIVDSKPEDPNAQVAPSSEGYVAAKTNYLNSKKLLEQMEKRLSTENIQLKLEVPPVKLWEKGEPAIYPARPNMAAMQLLAALLGTFLGLVFAGIYLLCASLPRNPAGGTLKLS